MKRYEIELSNENDLKVNNLETLKGDGLISG